MARRQARLPRIGDAAPDFRAPTTIGELTLSEWQGTSWVVLLSHPADFTPVCTTELAELARRADEFAARDVKLIGLSIDSVHAHLAWRENIREKLGVEIRYPLIADHARAVSARYGMIHPGEAETATVRALFVIDPQRTIRAIIYYPISVGRNVDEILRLVDALQTATHKGVALPVNWRPGDRVILPAPQTAGEVAERRATAPGQVEQIDFYLNKKQLDVVGS